jgi:hypothetical protein
MVVLSRVSLPSTKAPSPLLLHLSPHLPNVPTTGVVVGAGVPMTSLMMNEVTTLITSLWRYRRQRLPSLALALPSLCSSITCRSVASLVARASLAIQRRNRSTSKTFNGKALTMTWQQPLLLTHQPNHDNHSNDQHAALRMVSSTDDTSLPILLAYQPTSVDDCAISNESQLTSSSIPLPLPLIPITPTLVNHRSDDVIIMRTPVTGRRNTVAFASPSHTTSSSTTKSCHGHAERVTCHACYGRDRRRRAASAPQVAAAAATSGVATSTVSMTSVQSNISSASRRVTATPTSSTRVVRMLSTTPHSSSASSLMSPTTGSDGYAPFGSMTPRRLVFPH